MTKPKPKIGPGRPPGSRAIGVWLPATIANKLCKEFDVNVMVAAAAALDATYSAALDKKDWRQGTAVATVEQVRQAVSKIRRNPELGIQPSPDLLMRSRGHLKSQIEKLENDKKKHAAAGHEKKEGNTQVEINKLNEAGRLFETFVSDQKKARNALKSAADERGVSLTQADLDSLEKQRISALKASLTNNQPRPFTTPRKKK